MWQKQPAETAPKDRRILVESDSGSKSMEYVETLIRWECPAVNTGQYQ